MVQRQDLEELTVKKLREWAKRCELPSISSYKDDRRPHEYYVGIRAGPGIALRFNNESKMSRSWDLELKDGIKNKTRCQDIRLIYADPKFFIKIERFIKNVIRTRIKTAKEIAFKIESAPIFSEEVS